MFVNVERIFVLLMGNELSSCKEDVTRIKALLEKYFSHLSLLITIKIDIFPREEIINFITKLPADLNHRDLIYIHYSGHAISIGKKINNKVDIITAWKSPTGLLTYSNDIDTILSFLNCRILLISDSCYSGGFGKYFQGKNPFCFIGSSSLINLSREYSITNANKAGAIVNFLESCFSEYKLEEISISLLAKEINKFFKKYKIRHTPVIRYFNT